MRHVVVMTSAGAVGLLSMFGVDLVDMYFLTLLGEEELAAAVGYAGTLVFFLVSVSIGLLIALGALVARSVGARQWDGLLGGKFPMSSGPPTPNILESLQVFFCAIAKRLRQLSGTSQSLQVMYRSCLNNV